MGALTGLTKRSAALILLVSASGILARVDMASEKAKKPIKAKPDRRALRTAEKLIAQEHDAAVKLYREASGKGKKQVAPGLDSLQKDLADSLGALTGRLAAGEITNADWESEFEVLLARYHTAGLMLGQKSEDVGQTAAEYLIRFVGSQYEFLGNFSIEIQDAAEWQDGFRARAESYAGAIGAPYWSGDTQFLPLPAMPRDGTSQCLCIVDPLARVLTETGWKAIRRVEPGELVLTHMLRWRRVLGVNHKLSTGAEREVRLVSPSGACVDATDSHLWWTPEGWKNANYIDTQGGMVYHLIGGRSDGQDLPTLRRKTFEQESIRLLQAMSVDMPMRQAEGLSRCAVPELRESGIGTGELEDGGHAGAAAQSGHCSQDDIRTAIPEGQLASQGGRQALELVLGRRPEADGLPLSIGVDQVQRSNTGGLLRSPQERETLGRSTGESPINGVEVTPPTPRSPESCRPCPEDLSSVRPEVPTQAPEGPAGELLLFGLLPPRTTLFDLIVEEDHSFCIEGFFAHNSNCGCEWRIETLDDAVGDYDCYWERSKEDSCGICLQREADWNPIQIRAGSLV